MTSDIVGCYDLDPIQDLWNPMRMCDGIATHAKNLNLGNLKTSHLEVNDQKQKQY